MSMGKEWLTGSLPLSKLELEQILKGKIEEKDYANFTEFISLKCENLNKGLKDKLKKDEIRIFCDKKYPMQICLSFLVERHDA